MTGFLTAVLCGICNSLGGIGCKVGDNGGVHIVQTSVFLGLVGTFFFGIRGCLNSEFAHAPWEVWTIAAVVGLLQYLGMILLQKGLQSGSLSLVWCANCLGFMPALLFAHFVYGEPLSWSSVVSLFLIFGAIVSASFGGKSSVEEKKKFSLSFALILVGILLCFSSPGIALKISYYSHGTASPGNWIELFSKIHLPNGFGSALKEMYYCPQNAGNDSPRWLALASNLFMAVVYFTMVLCGSLDLSLRRAWRWNKYALWGGCMLSFGMLASFTLQISIMGLPGIIVFALSFSTSILATALVSTFLMGEKRTISWYCTLVFSLGAILMMLL